jgi:RNA polymerase sigma factor (sigma-70 family)
MWELNDGISESNILQNQFTAYLGTAIRRRKTQYLRNKARLHYYETSLELQDYDKDIATSADMMAGLPMIEQIENIRLQQALARTKQRDLYILLSKALEDRSLAEIAAELGLNYNTVAASYYRTLQRIKDGLGGDGK